MAYADCATWAFNQVSAVVHHGDFGTTAATLRAGVPGVMVPRIIDQFYWGQRVFEPGAARSATWGAAQAKEVAHSLRGRGVEMVGVDLSPRMAAVARRLNPGVEFSEGNMLALDVPTGTWAGIAAFYSIIHIPRENVGLALQEMKRVLKPGGRARVAEPGRRYRSGAGRFCQPIGGCLIGIEHQCGVSYFGIERQLAQPWRELAHWPGQSPSQGEQHQAELRVDLSWVSSLFNDRDFTR